MSQLQEAIRAMLPDDPRQAIPANALPLPEQSIEHIRTCLTRMLKAGLVAREPRRCKGMGRVFYYWRINI